MPLVTSSFLLLVAMPGATSSVQTLLAMPFAPSSCFQFVCFMGTWDVIGIHIN